MTLNRMYHWVPRIISGLSQMSGLSCQATIAKTAIGNSRLAGNAARNCAIGWTDRAQRAAVPTQTPIGTQIDARQRDQHDDAEQRRRARARTPCRRRASAMPAGREVQRLPQRETTVSAMTIKPQLRTPIRPRPRPRRAADGVDAVRTARQATGRSATAPANGRDQPDRRCASGAARRAPRSRGAALPGSCSKRNWSAQATSGRNSSWS